jgi:glyoxylase-like metal-dependent hydrolase (beta-lactamase superfamily II)
VKSEKEQVMKSAWRLSLVALAAGVAATVWAQGTDYSKIEFTAKKVSSNLYMLPGSPNVDVNHPDAAGGLVGVLAGPDGIFMVDAQYAQVSEKLLAAIRKISPEPIRFMANTHIHPDHTAGNPFFGKMGVTIFAREELREQMARPPRGGNANAGAPRDTSGYPVVTYGMGAPVKLHMNGEVIDLIPVRAAHTAGDTMIRFENANVIMIGDFYRNYGYPFIDRANGGTLNGMLEGCDQLMKVAGPDTTLIPGHGTWIKRTDLVPYAEMIKSVRDKVKQLIAQGKTEKEVVAAKVTAPWDASTAGGLGAAGAGVTSADRFVGEVYQELKAGSN